MLIAIVVDPMGSADHSVEEEIKEHKKRFSRLLAKQKPKFYQGLNLRLKPGTDILIYDFGGMLPGCDELLFGNARELIRLCQENPNFTALVVSYFTYRHQIMYELQELGLDSLPNLILMETDDDLPLWLQRNKEEEQPQAVHPPKTLILPRQRFFEPTRKFLKWLVQRAAGRIIIDIGCGEGHVTEALYRLGAKAIGIDRIAREGQNEHVGIMDARQFRYPKGCLVLFARPCYSDWVMKSLEKALDDGASEILYVGSDDNVKDDLGRIWYGRFDKIGFGAGKNEETVWSFRDN